MKKLLTALLLTAMVLSLSACGTDSENGAADSTSDHAADMGKETPTDIVIATGNSTGTFYFIGAGQAKILDEAVPDITYSVEATTGTKENLVFASESADVVAMAPLDYAYAAYSGDASMDFETPMDNLRLIMTGHSTSVHFVVLDESSIHSFADIKGKKIGLPANTSGYYVALRLFAAYGITENDIEIVYVSTSEAGDALKDGTVDMAVYSAGAPISAVTDLAMSKAIRMIGLEDSQATKDFLKQYPYYVESVIPGGTYSGIDEDVSCVTFPICLLVNNDLDDDIVYNMVKILNENTDKLSQLHALGSYWTTERTLEFYDDPVIPFADGAVKYYDEVK